MEHGKQKTVHILRWKNKEMVRVGGTVNTTDGVGRLLGDGECGYGEEEDCIRRVLIANGNIAHHQHILITNYPTVYKTLSLNSSTPSTRFQTTKPNH